MTLVEITHLFSTEKRCREFLRRLRWPKGVECPRCNGKDVAR
ncbi:MAG: transposase, partial [Terriglobia bacterium]